MGMAHGPARWRFGGERGTRPARSGGAWACRAMSRGSSAEDWDWWRGDGGAWAWRVLRACMRQERPLAAVGGRWWPLGGRWWPLVAVGRPVAVVGGHWRPLAGWPARGAAR